MVSNLAHTKQPGPVSALLNKIKKYKGLFPDATTPHEAAEPAVHLALIQPIIPGMECYKHKNYSTQPR